ESKLRREVEERLATPDSAKKVPFEGQGQRLTSASKGKSTKVTSSASSITSTTNNNNKGGKVVDILDQDGSEAPAALSLPLGNLYFGYKYVPPKSAQDAQATEVKAEPVFEGAGQTLRPPRKNARSGTNSPAPSMASSTGASSRAPTPAPPAPAEPKPDMVPFQGKGNTMR
ncbi:hypothetical protein CPB97_012017, partial [Podila verticillata]